MSNRARPNWPEGASDSAKPARPPQGGNGPALSTPPGSGGRANGSPSNRPDRTPERPAAEQRSPFQRPAQAGDPGRGQRPANQSPPPRTPSTPGRPAQAERSQSDRDRSDRDRSDRDRSERGQAERGQSGRDRSTERGASDRAAAERVTDRASDRSAVRTTSEQAGGSRPVGSAAAGTGAGTEREPTSYGLVGRQTGKQETSAKQGDSFGDRMTAAKQAVIGRATAVREASAERSRATEGAEATTRSRGQVRKARLRLTRLEPWSVLKTSFLLSIAFGIVVWVAVFVIWSAIGAAGVFDNINSTVTEVLGTPAAEPFRIEDYINTGRVMGFTTLLVVVDVFIITALATLGSFLYNIAATLLGGLEVTLASED